MPPPGPDQDQNQESVVSLPAPGCRDVHVRLLFLFTGDPASGSVHLSTVSFLPCAMIGGDDRHLLTCKYCRLTLTAGRASWFGGKKDSATLIKKKESAKKDVFCYP